MFMARREFPSVIYKNARHELYCRYSRRVMTCLREIVPDVEEVSVDEAYADLTSLDRVYRTDYTSLAARIRETIRRTADIPVSIGLGPSKLAGQAGQRQGQAHRRHFSLFPIR